MTIKERPFETQKPTTKPRIVFLYDTYELYLSFTNAYSDSLDIDSFSTPDEAMNALKQGYPSDIVVASADNDGWELLTALRRDTLLGRVPVLLVTKNLTKDTIKQARDLRADDIFDENFVKGGIDKRIEYLYKRKLKLTSQTASKIKDIQVSTPLWKRTLDLVFVGTALILLAPVFLLVALAIRIDSKGPVFYKSKRVGSGYKIFDLYKFRTMRTNADKLIKDMAALNIYERKAKSKETKFQLCETCLASNQEVCDRLLFYDGREVCEKVHNREKEEKAAFMKFQNDPRITRIGRFLRNTSLDELPQLVNILIGDMSLVGNRPLPLYEAEKLTTDDKILRFAGPAGLTGYWQVTKRSKRKTEITEAERIELDIYYVNNFSFLLDMKIILKTFPALIQSESV